MIYDKLYDLYVTFAFIFFYHPILKIIAPAIVFFLISCFGITLIRIDRNKKMLFLLRAFFYIPTILFIYDWCTYSYNEFSSEFSNNILYGQDINKITETKIYKFDNNTRWPTMMDLIQQKPALILKNKLLIKDMLSSLTSTDEYNCRYDFANIQPHSYVMIFKSIEKIGYVQVSVKEQRSYVSPLSGRYELGTHGWPNCNFAFWAYENKID